MTGGALRVLIEVNSADLRIGAVNDALDLAELARPCGAELVICGKIDQRFEHEAASRGIATFRGSSRVFSRRALPLYLFDVARWMVRLARCRPDIVHLNYAGYGPSIACAAWLCGIPVVSRAGGEYIPGNPANQWIEAYLANCEAHAGALAGTPLADRVAVTGDLFRPARVRSTMTPERMLPPRRAGVVRFTFLGQLVERKGLDILLQAFAQIAAPCELLLVGGDWSSPGFPQRLTLLADALGVSHRITCENHRGDIGAILSETDVFVLPSRADARPRSIIEAMSMGIPVVASDVGGIPTLVADEVTGLLVPAGEPAALAAALERLAREPEERAHFGAAARRCVEAQCRPAQTAAAYVDVYHRVIAAHAARAPRVQGA
jgi:hypothetical protein